MIVLDTNVYLDAGRDQALSGRVRRLVEGWPGLPGVSSVVVAELLIGAADPAERAGILADTLELFPADQVITPTADDWRAAGDALHALGGEEATRGRSFWNDLLIAASCARVGATLVTRNEADFRRIQRVIPVAVASRPA